MALTGRPAEVRTIAHISDLHFGRTDPQMVERLREQLVRLRPSLVVVSGDLTQRARPSEFEEARAFLDTIPKPQIVTPGNHDIELYNPYGRFVERLGRYRTFISDDVEPTFADSELMVASVNTARSLTFKGGRINSQQLRRLHENLRNASPGAFKILVTHHPLDLPEILNQTLVGGARTALRALAGSGIDLILSGHLHLSRFTAPAERMRVGGHTSLLVQAGTAVSTRSRGELNSFNWMQTARDRITIRRHCWSVGAGDFVPGPEECYHRSPTGWIRGD